MGYSTVYIGEIEIEGIVPTNVFDYINEFSEIRHMKRDNKKIKELDVNYKVKIFDYKLGTEGEYYVNCTDPLIGDLELKESVVDYNNPPSTQPGLWCQWILKGERGIDGYENVKIQWNKTEKFYDGYEWLKYIIDNFLKKKNLVCNGLLSSIDDYGNVQYIFVLNNHVILYDEYEAAERQLYSYRKERNVFKEASLLDYEKLEIKRKEWYKSLYGWCSYF